MNVGRSVCENLLTSAYSGFANFGLNLSPRLIDQTIPDSDSHKERQLSHSAEQTATNETIKKYRILLPPNPPPATSETPRAYISGKENTSQIQKYGCRARSPPPAIAEFITAPSTAYSHGRKVCHRDVEAHAFSQDNAASSSSFSPWLRRDVGFGYIPLLSPLCGAGKRCAPTCLGLATSSSNHWLTVEHTQFAAAHLPHIFRIGSRVEATSISSRSPAHHRA